MLPINAVRYVSPSAKIIQNSVMPMLKLGKSIPTNPATIVNRNRKTLIPFKTVKNHALVRKVTNLNLERLIVG
ncbi:MAG: hypothetical protein ACD_19C00078G0001 [uncultured bacterium]|nr:MAG: hypothetical protein ACD_19C00078G0001 [uncultured bacterium]